MASLTPAQLREHVTTSLGDDALARLLEAAWQAIAAVAGEEGDVTEVRDGGGTYVFLARPAAEVTEVTEWLGYSYERVLADDDFELRSDGVSLRRLTTGTTPATYWAGPVQVDSTPRDDEANRQATQIALVELFLNHHPGLTAKTIGDWTEAFASNSVWNYALERQAILDALKTRTLEFA